MTFLKKFFIVVFIFLGILTLAYASGQLPFAVRSSVDRPIADATLENLEGEKVNLTGLLQGQKAIIFFWATWCPHCREQLPEINRQVSIMQSKGIKMILIDVGEEPATVENFLANNAINTEVFLDQDSSVAEKYGLVGVPTFLFLNQQGIVKAIRHSLPADYEKILSP